jgi:hypothetical protein
MTLKNRSEPGAARKIAMNCWPPLVYVDKAIAPDCERNLRDEGNPRYQFVGGITWRKR